MLSPTPAKLRHNYWPLALFATVGFLIWLLVPPIDSGGEFARRTICPSNLRGIGQAEAIYANDNENWFPIHYSAASERDSQDDVPPSPSPTEPTP